MTANGYPGNPSLAAEVRQRVLTTFEQTLALYDEGQLDEVVAGCDLILEMDDRFDPARKLRQKAKDPAAPVDMSALYALRGSEASATGAPVADSDDQILQAVEELNHGNYEAAIEICNHILSSNPSHAEAIRIGQQANERLEAGPFISQFLSEADDAIDRGDTDGARRLIEKARSLDPLHKDIAAIAARVDAAPAASAEASAGSGTGFDFGGDASPFASAFGAQEAAGSGFEANFGSAETTPEPVQEKEPAAVDFATPAAEETPANEFAISAEPVEVQQPEESVGFGFTLEEEPAPDPVTAPGVSGDAQTFDFASGEVEVTDDDQKKITTYLAEGDDLFESGDYQGAIDAWSKIFLIDVTNEQASERIEAAKEKKREADDKLDELLNTGIAAYERRDYSTARASFEEVIAQDPDNFRAQEYLEKLADHAAATGTSTPPPPLPDDSFGEGEDVYQGDAYDDDFGAPPPPPPAATSAPAAPKAAAASRPTARKSPKGMIIGAVVVLALAVGGWFAWSMIGGSGDRSANVDSSVTQGKINRARALAGDGDLAQAISILSSIEAGDPMREQALQLIAQYKQQQAQTGGTIGGRPVAQVREELLTQARESFTAEDYLGAKGAFEEAAKLKPLDPADREMYEAASQQVSKLDAATTLFAQGSYREAIEEINRILAEEPDNVNASQMLVNAHYNLGVTALRNRNLDAAVEEFGYIVEQRPDDEMAQRSLEIASAYREKPTDLLYEIYVKYLPLR